MMLAVERPAPIGLLQSIELEITGGCQLQCTHCLAESSPQGTHGSMLPTDWKELIIDTAALEIPLIQLIGGEPTLYPRWIELCELALSLGRRVEVYSNLFHVKPAWWGLFQRDGVSLGTSYYSNDPAEHDAITGRKGSYAVTRCNIQEAVTRRIPIRVGIVDIIDGQHVAEARAELESMGVTRINTDRVRAVGRAASPGTPPTLNEMCGRCTRGRAAVLPNGDLVGCVLARNFPAGNVKEKRLADLLAGDAWAKLSASIPQRDATACQPDGSDCDPASTPACLPKYPNHPEPAR
ncbi:radical SAM protein [Streptomyces sp. NPDC057654]|uniref:radical SAM protein n=1 Tax=Streptomyces sp. NPDC057654 TaxID=3346196 RepID=UPI0036D13075